MKVTTIARNPKNSPNMTANDAAILKCISDELAAMGVEVTSIEECEEVDDDTDVVCHMTRTAGTLEMLKRAEAKGITVFNSPTAVCSCSRKEFTLALEKAGIPQPGFRIVESGKDLEMLHYPAWIKNATGWSYQEEDVAFATDAEQAKDIFAQMRKRGHDCCIHSCHIIGDLIKFYGIGDGFFHYCYPQNGKFGLEKINGTPKHRPFSEKELKKCATSAANAVGTQIYGGDCIIDDQGRIFVIDFNDFPSFSAIREKAAKEIATLIMKQKK